MLEHLVRSHPGFLLLLVGLGLVVALLASYCLVVWCEGRRPDAEAGRPPAPPTPAGEAETGAASRRPDQIR